MGLIECVLRRLRQRGFIVTREPDHGIVQWAGGMRTTLVYEHEQALILIGIIGPEALALPRKVLEMAGRMGAGGLALVGGNYVVRYTVSAADIDTLFLVDAVKYVATLAVEIQPALMRPKPHTELFQHYGA
jgi:hypothetical protein